MASNYKPKWYILSFDAYKYFSGNYIKNSPDYKNVSQRVKSDLLQYVIKNKKIFQSLNYPLSQCDETTSSEKLLRLRENIIEKGKNYIDKQLKVLIEKEKVLIEKEKQEEMNKRIYVNVFLSSMNGRKNSRFTDFFKELPEEQKTLPEKNIKNEQTDSIFTDFFKELKELPK